MPPVLAAALLCLTAARAGASTSAWSGSICSTPRRRCVSREYPSVRGALARSSASRCERTRPCVRAQSRTPAQKGTPRTWFNTIRRGRSAIRRSGQGSHRQRRCATALSQTARVGMAACRSASLSATKRRRARQARRRWRRRRAAELFPSASVMRGSWWRRWTERAFLCACARARVWELVSRCMSARVLAR